MSIVLLRHTAIWTETNRGLATARGEDREENGGALVLGQEPLHTAQVNAVMLNWNRLAVMAGGCKL